MSVETNPVGGSMDEIRDGLYDHELRRYVLERSDDKDAYEIRLSTHRRYPWVSYLSIWLSDEPKGTEKRTPMLNWESMRSLAKTLNDEADRQEAEWNELTDEEREQWNGRAKTP